MSAHARAVAGRVAMFLVAMVVLVLSTTAVPALAAGPDDPGVGGSANDSFSPAILTYKGAVCDRSGAEDASTTALPVYRWAGETGSMHSRTGGFSPSDALKGAQRQTVVATMFSLGDTGWSFSTGMVETALKFCLLDKVGGIADRTSAVIGNAIMSSGFVAFAVVCSVGVYLWRVGRRGAGGAIGPLLQKALILTLFGIMLAGAAQSSGGGADGSDKPYRPGVGSPGWMVTTTDSVVANSAASFSGSLTAESVNGADVAEAGVSKGPESCVAYVKAMKDIYKARVGKQGAKNAAFSVPMLLSSMWESTGLELWKQAQFGTRNAFGDNMYCRVLEYNNGSIRHKEDGSGATVEDIMRRAGSKRSVDGNALAWRYSPSNTIRDREWVGWAACSAKPSEGKYLLADVDYSEAALKKNCTAFFTASAGSGDDEEEPESALTPSTGNPLDSNLDDGNSEGSGGSWDWSKNGGEISDDGTSAAASDFLYTLHGSRNTGSLTAGFFYMVSSGMIAVVFGMFAISVMVAKIFALITVMGIFAVLFICLLPGTDVKRLVDYGKQYVGLSIFAWGAQFLLAVVAMITALLINLGNEIVPGGAGSDMAMVWTGLSPVIALVCLHMLFKRMRMPSPLKMSSGLAWGQMAANGAVAGGAAAGGGYLGARMMQRGRRQATQATRKGMNKLTGKERASQMAPSAGGKGKKAGPGTGDPETSAAASGAGPAGSSELDAAAAKQAELEKKKAEQAERKEAKRAAGRGDAETRSELAKVRSERGRGLGAAARSRVSEVGNQFREKPVRSMLKAGAVGAAVVATGGAAVPLAAIGAGVGAKAVFGGGGMTRTLKTANPFDRSRTRADEVEAYRRVNNQRKDQAKANGGTDPSAQSNGQQVDAPARPKPEPKQADDA